MAPKKQPLKYIAYEYIKNNVANCTFAPGTIINEELIHNQLQISRTPIRDAISRLEQEGLVKILPKKGVLVTSISLKELNELYETRYLLEPYAVLHYGNRIPSETYLSYYQKYTAFLENPHQPYSFHDMDASFHRLFIDATENSYFINMYSTIENQISRTRILTGNTSAHRLRDTMEEHIVIVQAALKNDWQTASAAMLVHLQESKNISFNYLVKKEEGIKTPSITE